MPDFISEDDLNTFDGWLRYQGVDKDTAEPDALEMWRRLFDEGKRRPKVGLMKIQRVSGGQIYAVAIQDGADLWLTLWLRCSPRGDVYILFPSGNRDREAHASYHVDGTFHQKSAGHASYKKKLQPLTHAFSKSEHLGLYGGHGKGTGAVCDRSAFDGVVIVEPGILGPRSGSVGIDLVEPKYLPEWNEGEGQRFYLQAPHRRDVFPRNGRPSVVITITR
ncbi:MAG: hypothetical protein EXQ98_00720 [Alphaproteobacteria bacterium]|nr:hypothetical protein [Alphaproteobacteria bacterium]